MILRNRILLRLALLLLPALALAGTGAAPILPTPADGGEALVLAPGVLVAPSPSRAYLTDVRGRVAAIDLDDGAVAWAGPARGKPLALDGDTLWVLAYPEQAGRLHLVQVDANSGAIGGSVEGGLPAEVVATPAALPASRFHILAVAGSGGLELHWQFEQWPLRGANLVAADGGDEGASVSSGVLRLGAGEGGLVAVDSVEPTPFRRLDLAPDERLPDLAGTQFHAADGGHVLTSVPVPDPVLGHRWRWQLHDRDSGRSAGSFLAPYSSGPFLVRGSTLLMREEPVALLDRGGVVVEQGVRLLAIDLATGQSLWSVELADPVFRGAPPP